MSVEAINHVQMAYPAAAVAAVRHFYGQLLQLPELPQMTQAQGCLRYAAGGQCIDLVPSRHSQGLGPAAHLALAVRDLAGFEGRLAQAHCVMVPGQTARGQPRLYVKDPAGNQLELVQAPAAG